MNFFDVVKKRRSIRSFLPAPIAEEDLRRILDAANAAPSAGNLQSYEIYVVMDKRRRESLARAAHEQLFVACAPVSLVFCTNTERCAERYRKRADLYAVQDATIACTFAMLAAAAQGLATVWVGAFETDDVRRLIGAPPGIVPVAILPVGRPAGAPEAPARRSLEDLVHWEGSRV
jgi:nitroreductase